MDSIPVTDLLVPAPQGGTPAPPDPPAHAPDEATIGDFATFLDSARPQAPSMDPGQAGTQPPLPTDLPEDLTLATDDNPQSPVELLVENQEDWRSIAKLDLARFEVHADPVAALQASPAIPLVPTPVTSQAPPGFGQSSSPPGATTTVQISGEGVSAPVAQPGSSAGEVGPLPTGQGSPKPNPSSQAYVPSADPAPTLHALRGAPGPQAAPVQTPIAPQGEPAATGEAQADSTSTSQTQPSADPRLTSSRTSTPTEVAPRPTTSMASTPESMLFTFEFDTAASSSVARASSPTVAPSLLSQLADASRLQAPLTPVAMPDEINLVIRDPAGDIRMNVGRDDRDVAVKLEVPTGLMAAVREAEAPIRASLQDEGYELEGYDVEEHEEQGVDQSPQRDRSQRHTQREGRGRRRHSSQEREATHPTRRPILGPRLLDRLA